MIKVMENGITRDATVDEIAAVNACKTNALAAKPAEDLADLRTERNSLLAETDFYGNSDVTMSDAMTTYRQALRDITNSATSLDDVTWPEKP